MFFRAFNAILGKVGRFASEEVVISLLRAKCLPILLYAIESCPLLSRNKHSFEFTVTRIFMKLFRTGSPSVVNECQANFSFLRVKWQIDIRTAKFLQQFIACENSLCSFFVNTSSSQLGTLFSSIGESVNSVSDTYREIFNWCS